MFLAHARLKAVLRLGLGPGPGSAGESALVHSMRHGQQHAPLDLMIVITLSGANGDRVHFYVVSDTVGKHGRHPPYQMFDTYRPCGQAAAPPFEGVILEAARLPHIDLDPGLHLPSPLDRNTMGMLDTLCADDLSALLLQWRPRRIMAQVLKCKLAGAYDTLEVLGVVHDAGSWEVVRGHAQRCPPGSETM